MQITFKSPKEKNAFYEDLTKQMDFYFKSKNINSYGNAEMYFKSILIISLWIASWYGFILYKDSFFLSILIGLVHMFSHVMIAFNIIHDANHNAMFKSKKLNKLFGHFIELLGSNRKLWIKSHNEEHHSYINIHDHDDNIQGYGLLRLCPYDEWLPHHKYQWLYAPFVYGLSTLNYATYREIKHLIRDTKKKPAKFYAEFIFFKLLYYTYIFIIPIFVFGVNPMIIVTFFLLGHFINGVFLAVIFVIGHLTENTSYPPLEGTVVNENWAIHVLKTTGDFSTKGHFLQWLVGGINLHVPHHLFPRICHVHYRKITPLIKEVAQKYNITYREIPSFRAALTSHFRLLKSLGTKPNEL